MAVSGHGWKAINLRKEKAMVIAEDSPLPSFLTSLIICNQNSGSININLYTL